MTEQPSLYNLELSDKFKPTLAEVRQFIADKVLPVEEEFFGTPNQEDRWDHELPVSLHEEAPSFLRALEMRRATEAANATSTKYVTPYARATQFHCSARAIVCCAKIIRSLL